MASLNDDGAMKLLEAMLKDSATDLKDGMWLYIKGRRKMLRALEDFGNGLAVKREGIKKMREEYKFLNGERPVQPLIDGEYVMAQLIKSVFDDLDEDDDFAKMLEGSK